MVLDSGIILLRCHRQTRKKLRELRKAVREHLSILRMPWWDRVELDWNDTHAIEMHMAALAGYMSA